MLDPKAKMCGECPMRRTSAPGWTGAASPEELIDGMGSDGPMPCHTEVDYTDPDWEESLPHVHQCTGQAHYLSNICKLPRHAKRLSKSDDVFASREDFLVHHRALPRRTYVSDPRFDSAHAYTPRETGSHGGGNHIVCLDAFQHGRLSRAKGDALCKPRAKFWGLEPPSGGEKAVTCTRCLEIAVRAGVRTREG